MSYLSKVSHRWQTSAPRKRCCTVRWRAPSLIFISSSRGWSPSHRCIPLWRHLIPGKPITTRPLRGSGQGILPPVRQKAPGRMLDTVNLALFVLAFLCLTCFKIICPWVAQLQFYICKLQTPIKDIILRTFNEIVLRTSPMFHQHCLGNDGTKPLPKPMLTLFCDTIWR